MNKQMIKTATTKLTRELTQAGVKLPRNQILEMIAHSFGYKNYNTLLGSLNVDENKFQYSKQDKDVSKVQRLMCIEVMLNKVIDFDISKKRDIYEKIVDLWEECRTLMQFDKANITTHIDREQQVITIDFSKHKQDYSLPTTGDNNGYLFFMMCFMDRLKSNVVKHAISDIRFIENIQSETNSSMMP